MNKKLSTGRLSNDELLAINSGINFVVLSSSFDANLAAGDRVLSVRFSRPVLKRPMTPKIADFVLAWVKTHPRHWVVEVTGHYTGEKHVYDETVEIQAYAKLDWLTEAYKEAIDQVTNAGAYGRLVGVSWKARIKTTAERRQPNG